MLVLLEAKSSLHVFLGAGLMRISNTAVYTRREDIDYLSRKA